MFTIPGSPVRSKSRRRPLRLEGLEERSVPADLAVGVNFSNTGSFMVPAVGNSGAVGPNNYVQLHVGGFAIYAKDGSLLTSPLATDSDFWTAAGVPLASIVNGLAEPHVVYDPLSQRWFATEITLATTSNEVLIARSNTSDPMGTWTSVRYVGLTSFFAGFPTLGVDANAVYIGTGDFTSNSGTTIGSTMTSIPKADLLAATPILTNKTTVTQLVSPFGSGVPMGWAPQVVTNFDPNDTTASMIATHYSLFNKINYTEITGTGAAGATFGGTTNLAITYNALPGKLRQPDGTRQISGGDDDRYTSAAVQLGDFIYVAHAISVNSSGAGTDPSGTTTDGIQLIIIRDSTNQVVAQKNYFNSNYDYSYPSLAVNQFGDIVMAVNRSGASTTDGYLGAYAVYAHVNPANPTSITFGQELELHAGTGSYHQQGVTDEAWGPASAISVDPNDPLQFWTTQEFAQSESEWRTQVSQVFVAPHIQSVTSPNPDGTYFVGSSIDITITFNAPVTVTGAPKLALNSGGTATYTSGSGTSTLTFTYVVGAGQSTGDLDYASTGALTLNGGTITGGADIAASLTLPAPGGAGSLGANKNIVIDAAIPSATNVDSTAANGTYGFGDLIPITITFSRPVVVTGSPLLSLNSGGTATYASGSGTNTLTFNYTVGANQNSNDLDYSSSGALTLNGGTIKDQTNNADANLTLPSPGGAGSLGANKNIVIDTTQSHVLNVTSPNADGQYIIGATIDMTVKFDKVVTVTGSPQIALNSGGAATYLSGSGTDTLTFRYIVAAGDSTLDLDYSSTNALTLNGGTIQASGLAADLTLPAPGGAGSLGANKNIVIDGVPPAVLAFRVLYGTRYYNVLGSTRFDMPWLIRGIQVVFSEPVVTGNRFSLTGLPALSFYGRNSTTLTWRFSPRSKGMFNLGLANTGPNALKDKSGNPIAAFSQALNVLYGDVDDNGVVNPDDEAAIRALVPPPYQLHPAGYNIFADLSGDGLISLIDVGIARSRKGTALP